MDEVIFSADFVQFARTKTIPKLSYASEPLNPAKLEPFREPVSGIDGYFYSYGESLIIYFAGSNEWRDWRTNLWFWQKKGADWMTEKMKCHRGYMEGFDNLSELIYGIVNAINPKNILIIGVSMGGAIAPICACYLHFAFSLPIKVVTFGAPRVFNRALAKFYNKHWPIPIYRVINRNDCVPRLPSWLFGFRHVGKKIQLSTRHWWRWSISDHNWDKYCINLKKYIEDYYYGY